MDFDEFTKNPHFLGAPTFSEFCKNRDKWLGRDDDVFSSAGNPNSVLKDKNIMKRTQFEVEGYKCKTIEECERVAKSMGIVIDDYEGHVVPQGGGQCDVLIKFISKAERARRDSWS